MNWILQSLSLMIIALLGIPVGIIIAKNTREEIEAGKKWIQITAIVSMAAFIASAFLINDPDIMSLAVTVTGFLFLVACTSLRKA